MSLLAAPFRLVTWKTVLFHLVGFGLAVIFFVATVLGITLSVGLMVIVVGFFLGYAVLWMIHGIAALDSLFVSVLLDTEVVPMRMHPRGGFLDRYRYLATSPATWKRTAYILLKLPLETLGFAVSVTAVASLALVAAPFVYERSWAIESLGDWFVVDTIGKAVLVAALGLVAGWFLLWFGVKLGRVSAAMASSLLTDDSTAPPPASVA